MLIKEIGIDPGVVSNNNDTYSLPGKNNKLIVNQHTQYLQKCSKLKVIQDSKVMSSIYCIPKLHKNPTKARFILASSIPSLKPLTKSITLVFKVVY